MVDATLFIKFNSSRSLLLYSLFPGQKAFLSVYHPTGSLEGKLLEGASMFKMSLSPKVISLLSDTRNCTPVDVNDLLSVAKAQKQYDQW